MSEKYCCPFGTVSEKLIICTAPYEETGALPQWLAYDKSGLIVTRNFCVKSCLKKDVTKPTLQER